MAGEKSDMPIYKETHQRASKQPIQSLWSSHPVHRRNSHHPRLRRLARRAAAAQKVRLHAHSGHANLQRGEQKMSEARGAGAAVDGR